MLCRTHHRFVHEEGVRIETSGSGGPRFYRPDGRVFKTPAELERSSVHWRDLVEGHERRGIYIDADTAATRWRGESMDYGIAVDILLRQARVAPADATQVM